MRRLIPIVLTIAASLTLAGKSFADDTLTLDLPPSQRALDERAAAAAAKAREAANAAASSRAARQTTHSSDNSLSLSTRGSLPSRGGATPGRVVGRMGEVQERSSIYRGQRSTGHLATVDAGTYIAINDETSRSYGVLMADGTTGWISKRYVKLLDYQVVSTGAPALPNFGDGSLQPRTGSEFFSGDPQALIREAYKYMGVPYQWGGNTEAGIDCSGFMKKIFAACGYALPRTAAEQTGLGLPIPPEQLQSGDRLYFGHVGKITHTGLYLGNGYFIHSSVGQHGVAISRLSDTTYWKIFICARR